MFVKSRCLYIINEEKRQSQLIYNEISKLGLISKYFSDSNESSLLNFLSLLPDQTIFSKSVTLRENEISRYFISLPFFSSHFKTPVKVGEYIWVYPYSQGVADNAYEINSYWLSRIHGYAQTEDVNFTFNDRDVLLDLPNLDLSQLANTTLSETGKAKKRRDQKARNKDLAETIVKPNIDFGTSTFELDTIEESYLSSSVLNSNSRSIPHVTKKSNDLVLQGSNNTLIRLSTENSNSENYTSKGSNTGEITIASGIGAFINTTYRTKSGKLIDREGTIFEDDPYSIQIPSDPRLPLTLIHENIEESLKVPEMYSYSELRKNTFNEGASNILEDASRITLSEVYNANILVNKGFDTFLNISEHADDFVVIEEDINLFDSKTRNSNIANIKKSVYSKTLDMAVKDLNVPTICLTSSNISLYARESFGSISLIKEYTSQKLSRKLNSYVKLNEKGDIFIDANRIFIGSAELEKAKGSFLNGKGTTIRLGESEDSQSLVLGEQLKTYLLEMLDVSRDDMNATKELFEETKKTFSSLNEKLKDDVKSSMTRFAQQLPSSITSLTSTIGAASATSQSLAAATSLAITNIYSDITALANSVKTAMDNFSADASAIEAEYEMAIQDKKLKRDEELSKRLEVIENNIDKILSKISKTS